MMRRAPSAKRVSWMMTSMALLIWSCSASKGISTSDMDARVLSRIRASSALFAWTVASEPSWPVDIAWSMSRDSPPRTSPTTIRSGRMRSELRTRSRMVTWPLPSTFGGRASRRITCDCWSWSSAESSIVMMRSVSGMRPESALRRVVFPVPVAPDTMMLNFACTRPARRYSMCSSSEPKPTISCSVKERGKRRIVSVAPVNDSGGMMTLTRSPDGRRASTIGFDSSTRRLTVDTIRSMVCISWSWEGKRSGNCSTRPPRSTKIASGPLTMISVIDASSRSGSSMPRPSASSTTRRISCERSTVERTGPSRLMMCPSTRSRRARRSAAASALISARSISSRSLARYEATMWPSSPRCPFSSGWLTRSRRPMSAVLLAPCSSSSVVLRRSLSFLSLLSFFSLVSFSGRAASWRSCWRSRSRRSRG